jgi:hypothetical protein
VSHDVLVAVDDEDWDDPGPVDEYKDTQVKHPYAEPWREALFAYHYPVSHDQVSRFARRVQLEPPWLTFDVEQGTRDQTMAFEKRFCASGRNHIQAWFEVIFWKLASTNRLGESRAQRMIEDLKENKAVASRMWDACSDFVDSETRRSFESLQHELFIVSKSIPVAATFPAFMCPERFPMVGSQIAKWARLYQET